MNLIALIPGLIFGAGLTAVVLALMPRHPQLISAIRGINEPAAVTDVVTDGSLQSRVGGWMNANMPRRSWLTVPTTDLRVINMTVEKYYYDKVLLGLTGLLSFSILGLFLQALGILPFYLPAALGIPVGIWLFIGVDSDVKKKATEARSEFTRAVAVYLELVAAELKRGRTAALALDTAAGVGRSWVFIRIRQELVRARYAGIAPWDALAQLSEEIDVPELADVAKIVRLSGEEDASIYETLRSRGKTLRHKLLAEEHEKANSASERMQMPLATTLFVYVGIIITPMVLRLFTT